MTAHYICILSILLLKATIKSAITYLNSFCFFYVLSKKSMNNFQKHLIMCSFFNTSQILLNTFSTGNFSVERFSLQWLFSELVFTLHFGVYCTFLGTTLTSTCNLCFSPPSKCPHLLTIAARTNPAPRIYTVCENCCMMYPHTSPTA